MGFMTGTITFRPALKTSGKICTITHPVVRCGYSDAAACSLVRETVFQFELENGRSLASRWSMECESSHNWHLPGCWTFLKPPFRPLIGTADFKNRNEWATAGYGRLWMTDYLNHHRNAAYDRTTLTLLKLYRQKHNSWCSLHRTFQRLCLNRHSRFQGKINEWRQKTEAPLAKGSGWNGRHHGRHCSRRESRVKIFPGRSGKSKLISSLITRWRLSRKRLATRDWMSAEAKVAANKTWFADLQNWLSDKNGNHNFEITTESYWSNVCRANHYVVVVTIRMSLINR